MARVAWAEGSDGKRQGWTVWKALTMGWVEAGRAGCR